LALKEFPDGAERQGIKADGYRAIGIKAGICEEPLG
jgi:hypothetical protein